MIGDRNFSVFFNYVLARFCAGAELYTAFKTDTMYGNLKTEPELFYKQSIQTWTVIVFLFVKGCNRERAT